MSMILQRLLKTCYSCSKQCLNQATFRYSTIEENKRQKELRKLTQRQKLNDSLKLQGNTWGTVQKFKEHTYPLTIDEGRKKDVSVEMPPTYSASFVEPYWYSWWEKEKFFESNSHQKDKREVFSMVIPPPNVTGRLHLGHALTTTIEDVLARWHRMLGHDVVWVPGCDHAGIATQIVVEKFIQLECGESRQEMGPEKFRDAIWRWKNKKGVEIYEQLRRLGASLDWKRETFTLDSKYHDAVLHAFVRLYEDDMIYRAERMVSWSPHMQTTLSDVEIDTKEISGPTAVQVPGYDNLVQFGLMHKFAYKLLDSEDEIVVATSRVETMFADEAVAVNPTDPRYSHLIGRLLQHPFLHDKHIPVIADSVVDMGKGTGAVKITPAHDRVDCAIGQRHHLRQFPCVDLAGNMQLDECSFHPKLTGRLRNIASCKQFVAREKIVAALVDLNLYRGSIDNPTLLRLCSRTGDVIEPRIKNQWFVRTSELALTALKAVESGELEFVQEKYVRQWKAWLGKTEDWCISRSLWWGHQIPAFRCHHAGRSEWLVAKCRREAEKKAAAKFGSVGWNLKQDCDVLDTWFSSAIFPFAVFGWPHDTPDLHKFYPLSLMETGHDLVFFWVARMVMLGVHLTGQVPFKRVVFHPMVRDKLGRKMSKSLGNVIDPLHIIDGASVQDRLDFIRSLGLSENENQLAMSELKSQGEMVPRCGADALRLSMLSYNIELDHVKYSLHDSIASRKFLNKIWNSFHLIFLKLRDNKLLTTMTLSERDAITSSLCEEPMDRWIRSRLASAVAACNRHLADFRVSHALTSLQRFWINDFCDVYLEYCKLELPSRGRENVTETRTARDLQLLVNMCRVGEATLRMLAPFAPFLSEELWQRLSKAGRWSGHEAKPSVCVSYFPTSEHHHGDRDTQLESEVDYVTQVLSRARRDIQMFLLPRECDVVVLCHDEVCDVVTRHAYALRHMVRGRNLRVVSPRRNGAGEMSRLLGQCVGHVDADAEFGTAYLLNPEFRASYVNDEAKLKQIGAQRSNTQRAIDKLEMSDDIDFEIRDKLTSLREKVVRIERMLASLQRIRES